MQLAHGGGGEFSARLIREVFGALAAARAPQQDAACVRAATTELAITTDSFVVRPLEFPGGDLGKLAVCGTVNDLAAAGAYPRWLAAAFILEEGIGFDLLERLVASLHATARDSGVEVVAADTKVVEQGCADGVFVTTTGIGELRADAAPRSDRARPGDLVLVSGTMGDHGVAVMAARSAMPLTPPPRSDCATLAGLAHRILDAGGDAVRCLRDPTRGGLAATVNELARDSGVALRIEESLVPVAPTVAEVCELLGLDPLQVANEGKLVAVVAPETAGKVLAAMREDPLGQSATVVGEVVPDPRGKAVLRTRFGADRVLPMPSGELLPRIC